LRKVKIAQQTAVVMMKSKSHNHIWLEMDGDEKSSLQRKLSNDSRNAVRQV
jgi:hypothetical protein